MAATRKVNAVRFGTGDTFVELGSHICCLYNNDQERDAVTVPFVRAGLADAAACRWVVGRQTVDEARGAIGAGVDVDYCERSGQLRVLTVHETYLRNKAFEADEMISFVQQMCTDLAAAFPYIRYTGEPAFLGQDAPGWKQFCRYESKLNDVVPRFPMIVLCQYNIRDFSGEIIAGVLQTHPLVVMGGVLIQNPFYIPPEKYLAGSYVSN